MSTDAAVSTSQGVPEVEAETLHPEPAADPGLDAAPPQQDHLGSGAPVLEIGRARRLRRAREEALAAERLRSGADASPPGRRPLGVTPERAVVLLQSAFRAM
jgi:hypothetical protein